MTAGAIPPAQGLAPLSTQIAKLKLPGPVENIGSPSDGFLQPTKGLSVQSLYKWCVQAGNDQKCTLLDLGGSTLEGGKPILRPDNPYTPSAVKVAHGQK